MRKKKYITNRLRDFTKTFRLPLYTIYNNNAFAAVCEVIRRMPHTYSCYSRTISSSSSGGALATACCCSRVPGPVSGYSSA